MRSDSFAVNSSSTELSTVKSGSSSFALDISLDHIDDFGTSNPPRPQQKKSKKKKNKKKTKGGKDKKSGARRGRTRDTKANTPRRKAAALDSADSLSLGDGGSDCSAESSLDRRRKKKKGARRDNLGL